jgi:hypothetical protein
MYLDVSLEKWVVKPLGWLRPIFIFKYFLNYLDLRFYMFERFDQSSWDAFIIWVSIILLAELLIFFWVRLVNFLNDKGHILIPTYRMYTSIGEPPKLSISQH